MPAYVIAQVRATDPAKFEIYRPLAAAAVEKYGGRYIARGGAKEDLEGTWDVPRLVILEFPSVDVAKQWYASPEYGKAIAAREGGGTIDITVVEGV